MEFRKADGYVDALLLPEANSKFRPSPSPSPCPPFGTRPNHPPTLSKTKGKGGGEKGGANDRGHKTRVTKLGRSPPPLFTPGWFLGDLSVVSTLGRQNRAGGGGPGGTRFAMYQKFFSPMTAFSAIIKDCGYLSMLLLGESLTNVLPYYNFYDTL